MQRQSQHPLRPMPVQGSSELQQLIELARAGNLQQPRSAFSTVSSAPAFLPEFSLYNAAQLSGLLGNSHNTQLDQLAQFQQLQNLQTQAGAAALLGSTQQAVPESSTSRNSQGRGNSRSDKSSTAYASRHQAAEQRRRTRINDRLERLRQVVPHSERANTATFLEEVIKYVEVMQARITQLETAQGLPLSCQQQQKQVAPPPQPLWLPPGASSATLAPSSGALFPPSQLAPSASPAVPATNANAVPGADQSLVSTQAVLPMAATQRDRPETPPQNSAQDPGNSAPLVKESSTAATPTTSDEGNTSKKRKLEPAESLHLHTGGYLHE